MTHSRIVVCLFASALLGVGPAMAPAAEEAEYGRTPPRLSFVDGEVSFWRPGSEDWAPARLNLPLAPGDALYSGAGANLELQIGVLGFVRAGELSQLSLANQEADFIQMSLALGHLAVDVRSLPSGHLIEIDTPGAAVVIDRAGYYRFRVTDERTSVIVRRGGRATVTPADDQVRIVAGGQRVTIDARDRVAMDDAPDADVWDRWNYDRTDQVADATGGYMPPGVYGGETLERYGTWRNEPTYGWVWAPRVAPGWVPYSAGSWIWDPYYGWTWVDDAPWGWAPAHYGRWIYANSYWAWAPGPVVVTPFYAPAVVAFFGGSVGVSVGFGVPAVSWVALGWGEPLYPWWGPVGFYGRPCWYGWGGPRWHHRHDHHGDDHHDHHGPGHYRNAKEHDAIRATDRNRFGHGPVSGERVPRDQMTNLAPVGRELPKPSRASFAPQQGATVHPPKKALAKPVVATRPAQDPSTALQAAGVSAPVSAPRRPARLVSAPPQSAPRAAPPAGRADTIDRSPMSAPRSGQAPRTAPDRAPAVGGRPRDSGVGSSRPSTEAPVSAPRSAPAARVPAAPPESAPRRSDRRGGVGFAVPADGTHTGPRSAPRSVGRSQPPAPPMSAPRQAPSESSVPQPRHGSYSAPPRSESAPPEAPARQGDSAPVAAPRSAPRAAPPPMRAPSSSGSVQSAPMGGPVNRGPSGTSVGGPSSAAGGGGYSSPSGPSSAPRSGSTGSHRGGASHAPRRGSGSGSGGVGSGPRD